MLDIPYTHSSPTVHAIGLNKEFTKLILKSGGIARVPGSQTVNSNDFVLKQELKFPIIVKPNKEGSSKGVLDKNIVSNEKDLRDRVENLLKEIRVEVLIEEYINGREFTVAVLGNNPPKVLPIIEQKFDFLPKGMNRIASYELKWLYEDTLKDLGDAYVCPAKVEEELRKEIEETSIKVFKFLDVKDCARIDYRLNVNNELYFLEINTLPGINPDETVISYFPIASRAIGMKYKDLIESILKEACKRQGIAQ
jgi:D-alanine-D-alanine ligase